MMVDSLTLRPGEKRVFPLRGHSAVVRAFLGLAQRLAGHNAGAWHERCSTSGESEHG